MLFGNDDTVRSGIFITFSGNCKEALKLYQKCFGGELHFETFDEELDGYAERPVIRGTLISECIVIHGSDLVHDEGRKIGNYLSVFLPCKNAEQRDLLISKLKPAVETNDSRNRGLELVEIVDAFAVRWILGL